MLKGGVLPSLCDGAIRERVGLVRPDRFDKAGLVVLVIVKDGVCISAEPCPASNVYVQTCAPTTTAVPLRETRAVKTYSVEGPA